MNKIENPHYMVVGVIYYITEPYYDDFNEGLSPETSLVEVIKKTKNSLILKDIEHNFTYERSFKHLMDCIIEYC